MTSKIEIIKLTPDKKLQTNNYLFKFENKNILIDVGLTNIEELSEKINKLGGKLDLILLTHGHYDHIAGLELLIDKFPDVSCYINEDELIFLRNIEYNVSRYFDREFIVREKYFKNIKTFKDGEIIDGIRIIHTPGHTIGGSCFYIPEEHICFTGDTLFTNGYGRTDGPTGDTDTIYTSLDKLHKLPPETVIYPGHGRSLEIGELGMIY